MNTNTEKNSYTRNRTVQIEQMLLSGKNLEVDLFTSNHLVLLNIYENMYSNFITGEVTIVDNSGMFALMPIVGDETLTVSFKPSIEFPGPLYTKTFRVIGCKDLATEDKNSKTRKYELSFCSEIALRNKEVRIRRAYKGMTQDVIVSDICTNLLNVKVGIRDTCKYPHDIVVPAWHPLFAINSIAKTGVRASGYPSSNFLFFEDKDGFVFDSVDRIATMQSAGTMDFHLSRVANPRNQAKLINCRQYSIEEAFNVLESSSAGMYGHRYFNHDIIKKKVNQDDWLYSSEFDAHAHFKKPFEKLNEKFSDFPEQKISFGPRQKGYRYESEHSDDYMKRRPSQIREMDNYRLKCLTEGNTNISVGMKYEMDMISNEPNVKEPDKKLSGDYLVSAIKHSVSNSEHNMVVELSTESLIK